MILKKEIILSGDQNQLNELLKTHYVAASEISVDEITHNQRLAIASALQNTRTITIDWSQNVLPALIANIEQQFSTQPSLFKAELQFSLVVLENYVSISQLEEQLNSQLQSLRTTLLAHSIADPQFWINTHPLKRLIDFLYQQMIGWQAEQGEFSTTLLNIFSASIEKIVAIPLLDNQEFLALHKTLKDDFAKFNVQFEECIENLKNSETEAFQAMNAELIVISFINEATKGKKLPAYIIHFLKGKFVEDMLLLIISVGEVSSSWTQWKKLITGLVNFYQVGALVLSDLVNKNILLKLPKEIEKLTEQTVAESDEFDDFITEISYDFSQIALGKDIDGLVNVPVMEKPNEIPNVDRLTTKSLINKAKEYQIKQWFLYKDDAGKESRCKLVLSIGDYQMLVFANFIGQKVLAVNLEDFAYLLAAQHLKALQQVALTDQALSLVVDNLLDNFEALYSAKQSGIKASDALAIIDPELSAKKIAAEKAKTEAVAISERKVEDQSQVLAKIADEMKRHARLTLNSLALGSWVEIQEPGSKEFKRIKLAVKYNATGRYVFVDADGQTVAEHMRDDLIDMVLFKKLKLLESDTYFADRLSRIVKTIRNA